MTFFLWLLLALAMAATTVIGGLAYWLVGYPLAFGKGNSFCGASYWASAGLPDQSLAFWFFQFVFAATAATIVSGSMAERCAFNAYLIYSIVLTGTPSFYHRDSIFLTGTPAVYIFLTGTP